MNIARWSRELYERAPRISVRGAELARGGSRGDDLAARGTLGRVPRHDWISFLTDYGLDDVYVGVCHGVLARMAPHARVIDVCHTVPPGSVAAGARLLAKAAPYLPGGVLLAVVDPGVGTARRGVALLAARSALVGPDNGLLLPAAEALGGVRAAVELTAQPDGPHEISATFHGRDVFAPAAAHLALGADPAQLGPPVAAESLVRLAPPVADVTEEGIVAEVALVDGFGNLQTTVPGSRAALPLGTAVPLVVGDWAGTATAGRTFADVPAGELLLYVDSSGYLAVAVNGGSAARALGAGIGAQVRIGRHPAQYP